MVSKAPDPVSKTRLLCGSSCFHSAGVVAWIPARIISRMVSPSIRAATWPMVLDIWRPNQLAFSSMVLTIFLTPVLIGCALATQRSHHGQRVRRSVFSLSCKRKSMTPLMSERAAARPRSARTTAAIFAALFSSGPRNATKDRFFLRFS